MTSIPLFTKDEVKARIAELRVRGVEVPADYNLACFIADNALGLQRDKAGTAYAHHTSEVSRHNTDSETKMMIGKLHDVVEDSGEWTLDDLREVGFSERVVAGVDGMTRRPGEAYFDFIVRGGCNPDSLDVKLKDLDHNLSMARNNFLLGQTDLERVNKYIVSYNYLVAIKKEEIAPGTPIAVWMAAQPAALRDNELVRRYSGSPPPPAPAAPAP